MKHNKTAVVTGGASGIGLAIARKLVENNISTIIIGRDEEKLKRVKEELGDLCSYYKFDLTNLKEIPALVNTIISEHHTIDILINNAGVHLKKAFTEVTDEEFNQVVLTNLTAVFVLSREVARHMLLNKEGNIILISSMAAQYGLPKVIAYTAAKSGIEGMTQAMAVELSPHGIRVNCIAPGFINTEMSSGAFNNDPERKEKALARTPIGKFGTPADVGDAAYFLVSDAARYITGVVLPVDGGNAIGF
jgi:NAD(P)-dependent dehydrogenase (short-subunit alcohol dehydrogenase family)